MPTIGIGAGPACDGQVLVFHDLLGLGKRTPPNFVRQYADVGRIATEAIAAFADDVRRGGFPGDAETYHAPRRAWAKPWLHGLMPAASMAHRPQQTLLLTARSPGAQPGPEGGTPPMRPYEVMAIFEATTEPRSIQGVLDHALEVDPHHRGQPRRDRPLGASAPSPTRSTTSARVTTSWSSSPAEPETVAALDRMLTLADEVVRHKVVRLPDSDGRRPGRRAGRRADEPTEEQTCPDNSITLVGNITRDPELRFTNTGQANVTLRSGGQPPLAEPPDPGVGGGHLVLRRGLLARDGRERERVPHPRRPGHGHRPARAAELGDPGRRQALQGRGRGRRDRPVPALGHRRR